MEIHDVNLKEWPKDQHALLSHKADEPIPVEMRNKQANPFHVNMNMNMALQRPDTLPVCIKICEPICAESNYSVGIHLFGQPFAEILVKGVTRLFSCSREETGKIPDVKKDERSGPDSPVA